MTWRHRRLVPVAGLFSRSLSVHSKCDAARARAYAIAALGGTCAIDLDQRVAGLDAGATRGESEEDATNRRLDELVAQPADLDDTLRLSAESVCIWGVSMAALLDRGLHDQRIESERGYGLIAARVDRLHRGADERQGSRRAATAFRQPGQSREIRL